LVISRILASRSKRFLDLLALNSKTVLANAVSALRVKRTPVLRTRSLGEPTDQRDTTTAFTAPKQSGEKMNLLLLSARKAGCGDFRLLDKSTAAFARVPRLSLSMFKTNPKLKVSAVSTSVPVTLQLLSLQDM